MAKNLLPKSILDKYEVHEYHHAIAILATDFPKEFKEICAALNQFKLIRADITTKGGSESQIPKKFSKILRPLGWKEEQLKSKLVLEKDGCDVTICQDTHYIDFVKERVALDLEWNSKDQTFDRDLFAFKAFFDHDKISVGIIVTRSAELNPIFNKLGDKIKAKYGASTTWMGKLLPRLNARRNGGCPILVFGITPRLLIENS